MKLRIPFRKKPPVVPVIRLQGAIGTGGRFGAGLNDATLAPLIEKGMFEKLAAKHDDPEFRAGADENVHNRKMYEAAGASGGQPVFDALIAEYAKAFASTDDDRDIPLRGGLRAFPAESVAWAKANLPKAKDDHTAYADLITDSAAAADLPTVVEMLGATKDVMARNRLAAKAIELGDTAHFDVFIVGLKSKDQYDRSDSANFLADVADKAPADKKAELIDLLQKGKAGDQGGLTAMGYDKALKALGAP